MADIGGWVTIDNNSGKKYVDAKLKLIAGDVKIVTTSAASALFIRPAAPAFSQQSFADYHLYTLSEPVTLNESSQKQVEFIPKVYDVPIRKYHLITLSAGGEEMKNLKPTNKIQFINSN